MIKKLLLGGALILVGLILLLGCVEPTSQNVEGCEYTAGDSFILKNKTVLVITDVRKISILCYYNIHLSTGQEISVEEGTLKAIIESV